MVKQAKSAEKLQLVEVQQTGKDIPHRKATNCKKTSETETAFIFLLNAEASVSEEPGAVVPHAGICAGGVRVTGVPTATKLFSDLHAGLRPVTGG